MMAAGVRRLLLAAAPAIALAWIGAARADDPAAKKPARQGGGGLLPGANSKEPVSIDAGKLDYFDKEGKLVYAGSVVAKQGESTLRASVLTIFLNKETKKPEGEAVAAAEPGVASGQSIKRMEAQGPVTVLSKDEVGTGDAGSYDKAENRIVLTGNVTLTQATNIIKGDKLVYDMTTGQAQVFSGQTAGRVRSVFTPGSGGPGTAATAKKSKAGAAPATRKPQTAADP